MNRRSQTHDNATTPIARHEAGNTPSREVAAIRRILRSMNAGDTLARATTPTTISPATALSSNTLAVSPPLPREKVIVRASTGLQVEGRNVSITETSEKMAAPPSGIGSQQASAELELRERPKFRSSKPLEDGQNIIVVEPSLSVGTGASVQRPDNAATPATYPPHSNSDSRPRLETALPENHEVVKRTKKRNIVEDHQLEQREVQAPRRRKADRAPHDLHRSVVIDQWTKFQNIMVNTSTSSNTNLTATAPSTSTPTAVAPPRDNYSRPAIDSGNYTSRPSSRSNSSGRRTPQGQQTGVNQPRPPQHQRTKPRRSLASPIPPLPTGSTNVTNVVGTSLKSTKRASSAPQGNEGGSKRTMGVGGDPSLTKPRTQHPTAPAPASIVEKPPTGLVLSLTAGITGLPSGTAFYMNYSYNLDQPDHYLMDNILGEDEFDTSEDSSASGDSNVSSFEDYRNHALESPASGRGKTKAGLWRRELHKL
ncbi:hypothetical protein LTR86_009663 [Recurvomyces mirabilis]|nr:hypothetical protein LTR86_009663 [Recurvomyces mirabilis]